MSNVIERIDTLMRHYKMSETAFAREIGVGQATLNNYTTGKREVGYKFVNKLLQRFPNVSAEWFMRGVGNMMNDCCGDDTDVYTHAGANNNIINNNGDNNGTQQINDSSKDLEIKLLREQVQRLDQMLQQNNQLMQLMLSGNSNNNNSNNNSKNKSNNQE